LRIIIGKYKAQRDTFITQVFSTLLCLYSYCISNFNF